MQRVKKIHFKKEGGKSFKQGFFETYCGQEINRSDAIVDKKECVTCGNCLRKINDYERGLVNGGIFLKGFR